MPDFFANIMSNSLATAVQLFPIVFISALITIILFLPILWNLRSPENKVDLFYLFIALSLIGSFTGFAGGYSRDSVVGDIIPAALVFLGTAAIWQYTTENKKTRSACLGVIAFTLSLSASYTFAALKRDRPEQLSALETFCQKTFTDPEILGNGQALRLVSDKFGCECASVLQSQMYVAGVFDIDEETDQARILARATKMKERFLSAAGLQPNCDLP